MKRLKVKTSGILYRNENPGYRAECAYLPNVLPLSAEELLCILRIGSAFYSSDGVLAVLRSKHGRSTWTREGLVWDPRKEQTPYSYTAPHATQLSDGTLLLIASRIDCTEPERPLFNPDTGGSAPTEIVLFRSSDKGLTWSAPESFSAK